ncbi:hypothetical protein IFT48_03705 [Pseudomonas fluorescens]|uniref:hypothetical protein n=1 Tax=Pseudomonas TaxID=286 RepID=UPI000F020A3C|nr:MULTISPECIES: hypothetical protein [Pseudomonas]MBD8089075.1 hypothetical protein [Pseudomonas fluorescens]MBD8615499.1 hypothetical protein [Pseudomonas putida]MBD8681848.1 hypothetical protein [Pseudomonas sp. CFBP 13719]
MRKPFRALAGALLVSLFLTGCSTVDQAPAQPQDEVKAPAAHVADPVKKPAASVKMAQRTVKTDASPEQVGQLLMVWVAGYCEGWSKATGQNFEMCFETTLQDTLHQYQDNTGVDVSLKSKK